MEAICFDMDGVLVQSEEFWIARQRDHILPRTAPDDEIPLSAVTGRYYGEIYPELAEEYDVAVSREEFEGMFEAAGETIYGEEAHFLDGGHELLSALTDAGVPLALVTSCPVDWVSVVDDRFGLGSYFDAFVSAERIDGPGKPAPGIYERGAAELGVSPNDCVAVEDSTAGVRAATDAGMYTIGFRAYGGDADLTRADEVVEGVEALRATLPFDV